MKKKTVRKMNYPIVTAEMLRMDNEIMLKLALDKVKDQKTDGETKSQKLLALSNMITEKMQLIVTMTHGGHMELASLLNVERKALCEAFQIMARIGRKN